MKMRKNKKRFLRLLKIPLLLLLTVTFVFPWVAFASEEDGTTEGTIPFLTDENGYLTDEEAETVSDMLEKIYEDYDLRLVIYTEPQLPSDFEDGGERAYDLYYRYDDFSGILFYISGDRYYHLLTTSVGYYVFGDDEITEIENGILPYMRNDEMFEAFTEYAKVGRTILENADLDAAYAEYEDYMNRYSDGTIDSEEEGFPWFLLLLVLTIPLIIAAVMTGIKSAAMKTARARTDAAGYLRNGSLNIKQQQDIFLYSTVTRTAKPEPEHNSGGSSGGDRGPTGGHGGRF